MLSMLEQQRTSSGQQLVQSGAHYANMGQAFALKVVFVRTSCTNARTVTHTSVPCVLSNNP
jgi:hypothetical protein